MIGYTLWSNSKKEWWGMAGYPVKSTAVPKIWNQRHHCEACMKRGKARFWTGHVGKWEIIRVQIKIHSLDKGKVNI